MTENGVNPPINNDAIEKRKEFAITPRTSHFYMLYSNRSVLQQNDWNDKTSKYPVFLWYKNVKSDERNDGN